jgi:hypothetical protein
MSEERLMRVVVASGFVAEQDVLTYAPNAVTKALSTRQMAGLVEAMYAFPRLFSVSEHY